VSSPECLLTRRSTISLARVCLLRSRSGTCRRPDPSGGNMPRTRIGMDRIPGCPPVDGTGSWSVDALLPVGWDRRAPPGQREVCVMPTTARPRLGRLPAELSSFVGRRREVGELKRRLTDTRLLTLTGVGGVGKTRLGLRMAAEVQRAFPD